MSGCGFTVTVAAPAPLAIVDVRAPGRPAAEVLVPGPAGASAYALWRAAGHSGDEAAFLASLVSRVPGPAGPAGDNAGGGYVVLTERTVGPEDLFEPGVPGQLRFSPDPAFTKSRLNRPFRGHAFWANDRIVARALDDQYDVTVNLLVVADMAGGTIKGTLDVGSPLAPIASDSASLLADASVQERISLFFAPQVAENFLANGARVMLTADRPLRLVSETLFIRPRSFNPGDAA